MYNVHIIININRFTILKHNYINCFRQQLENIIKEDSLEINLEPPIKDDKPYKNIIKSIHAHKGALRFAL